MAGTSISVTKRCSHRALQPPHIVRSKHPMPQAARSMAWSTAGTLTHAGALTHRFLYPISTCWGNNLQRLVPVCINGGKRAKESATSPAFLPRHPYPPPQPPPRTNPEAPPTPERDGVGTDWPAGCPLSERLVGCKKPCLPPSKRRFRVRRVAKERFPLQVKTSGNDQGPFSSLGDGDRPLVR